ncbi:acyl-CoA dehydrogenase family protein [Paraburkholderia saeva]|uniref:Isobutylamine N-hydroxylase n=1 Tax=Paraburkholderia saeva TaxID=2777537 RepID=A0A9N8RYV2_9BURK|nr:acyl-CoA dehydrogenase family protein [Paraburkholderia saeva]CAG4908750.1 Isobutylamine N-hydroxylase [Paraburkholderia saeva]
MFLEESRGVLEQYAPGLEAELAGHGLLAMESKDPQEIKALIRKYHLLRLWVPASLGGAMISPYDGIRLQRAIGARAPSMALMLTMHNFTVSFCGALADYVPLCARMLHDVAHDNLLVASAFAEGRRGAGILDSTVYVAPDGDGFRITGSKKPCTMANSMDIITVGVAMQGPDGIKRTGMAILPANASGVTRHRFWNVPLLAAADSEELRFDNVRISADQVLLASEDDAETASIVAMGEAIGLCWFEIVASASYLGVVSAMADRVVADRRVEESERVLLAGELECAQAALDGAIHLMQTCQPDGALLARVLMIRFGVQRALERCAMLAAELAGGLAYIRDTEIMTLLAASRCLAFHPIGRKAAQPMLAAWLESGADVDGSSSASGSEA